MKTRYRINKFKHSFDDFPHIDLLHPCRRIYREHFDSFNLSILEEQILGFERKEDVPSHLIPHIYFDFLQTQDEDLLFPILNHNRDDIVSLYVLAQETAYRIGLAIEGATNDDRLYFSISKILFAQKRFEESGKLINLIKEKFASDDIFNNSLFMKSAIAKKLRDWQTAQDIWRKMIKRNLYGCYPHVELAKHMEHRERDFDKALDLTNSAIGIVRFENEMASSKNYKLLINSLTRRKNRLLKRKSRSLK
jgi:hypothetical protein